jgi:CHASE3 domain sensor protein
MQKRTSRLVVAAILMAAGTAGGFFVFDARQKSTARIETARAVSERIDRMVGTVNDISSAQQGYVALGQPLQPWLERNTVLSRQLGEELAALRTQLQSVDAARLVDESDRTYRALVAVDGTTRADLQQDQSVLAADVIFGEGRETAAMLVRTLQTLRHAELAAADDQRAASEQQQAGILGGVAAMWLFGVLMLVFLTPVVPASATQNTPTSALTTNEAADIYRPLPSSFDIGDAAEVCSALARTVRAEALPDVLAQAAAVLDAHGIIVWMGAGDELFPALVHGYDERIIERLGPLARNAANPTAEAWRTGEVRTVAADASSHGALAVPMSGVAGCVGVLAAELRHGREGDRSTQAVAAILAAQLVSILPAWPTGSSVASENIAASAAIAVPRRG